MNTIKDTIYGKIKFESNEEFLYALINTTTFQRTRKLKQLGLCFRTFTGAVHTRFSHCIGAFWLAKKLLNREEFRSHLSQLQINTIKTAALLHDIGHGPHSHGFEWYLKELGFVNFEHEDYSCKLIETKNGEIYKILKNNQINPHDVASLIRGIAPKTFPKWTSSIISSQIDVDRLDYLVRDEYFALQTTNNTQNLTRLLERVHIDDKLEVLYYEQDDVRLVNDFLYTRYKMYEELYLEPEVNNWYNIIILLFFETKKLFQQKYQFKDTYNLWSLYQKMFTKKMWTVNEYLQLTDESFNLFLKSLSLENTTLKKLYKAYETGDFKVLKGSKIPKKVSFYQFKKPIYIQLKGSKKLIPYEESQDFSKIFRVN